MAITTFKDSPYQVEDLRPLPTLQKVNTRFPRLEICQSKFGELRCVAIGLRTLKCFGLNARLLNMYENIILKELLPISIRERVYVLLNWYGNR